MASIQRVALFILFDEMERDLVAAIRGIPIPGEASLLSNDERERARMRVQSRPLHSMAGDSDDDLLYALDLGDKFAILMRHRNYLPESAKLYFQSVEKEVVLGIPVRNSVMHGRPLTTTEYVTGFNIAGKLIQNPTFWPNLSDAFSRFQSDPQQFVAHSMNFVERGVAPETLHNLPDPDYDDTGFLPRPYLERDLRKKLQSRNPVVTVLGDGGNGKTALTLQVLYGMVAENDGSFDAIVWVSAKSSRLGTREIERIQGSISESLGLFEQVADQFEPGGESAIDRVRKLMEENNILLVIDNLETVLDETVKEFASDIPGESKVLFTSRVPLGSDLTVSVGEFDAKEAKAYFFRLVETYGAHRLKKLKSDQIDRHIGRLGRKPLLLKWFVIGVVSGLEPDSITANPHLALQYCMENVVDKLESSAMDVAAAMAALPSGVSPGVLQHVTDLSAPVIESGIAELLRFALIERDHKFGEERVYVLKPFVRAYISRVLKRAPVQIAAMLARYRSAEGVFQAERGRFDRYENRSYVVRSKTEAVACRRLRRAAHLILVDSFQEAEQIISELKITTPEYFEIYRVEAFLAEREGDISRAKAAYETALELSWGEPQTHWRYATFLTRAFGEHAIAYEHLTEALEQDRGRDILLRDLARNRFFVYEFEESQKFIDEYISLPGLKARDKVIGLDLQAQRFVREADVLEKNGNIIDALACFRKLFNFLSRIDGEVVDQMFVEHLRKALPTLGALGRILENGADLSEITALRVLIEQYAPDTSDRAGRVSFEDVSTGVLKQQGLRDNFGFIRDARGRDTFVSRNVVSPDVWTDMVAGRSVQFEIARNSRGQTYAVAVEII